MVSLSSSLVIVILLLSISEECQIAHLKGDVLGCIIDGDEVQASKLENSKFVKESSCFIEDSAGVKNYLCNGTAWIITEKIHNHVRQRHKRFLGGLIRAIGRVVVGVVKGFTCVVTLLSCLWAGRDGPIDNTRPDIRCGQPVIIAVAEPYQTYALVFYKEPTAYDETDGSLTPVRVSGRASGHLFPEGITTVTYEVKDHAGHRSSCDIQVNIKVIRCPAPTNLENGYFQCHPVNEFLQGGSCHFGCYEGFDLEGSSEISCQNTGTWSASQPICKPWTCSYLPDIQGAGLPSCTNGNYFRSICTYRCTTGFDMPPKVSSTLVCDKTKTWRKCGEPKCVDVEPPMFETCPSMLIGGTDNGVNTTEVSWNEPKVKDNSGKVRLYMKKGEPTGSRFGVGTHSIQYGAEDEAGNIALNDCLFEVVVRDIRCPKLYPTPFVHFECPDGYRSGARCSVHCDPGKTLSGSNDFECTRSTQGLYADWKWKDGEQAACKSTSKCVPITPPIKGAVACDNWEGGQYCQIQCENGTEMSSVSLNKLYVCSLEGDWSFPLPDIKTCKEQRRPLFTLGATALYYFTGNCSDGPTQLQIANNFITRIKNSLYQSEACPDSIECNTNNVQISCGATSRRKRSIPSKDSLNMTLKIVLKLPFKLTGKRETSDDEPVYKLLERINVLVTQSERELFGDLPVVLKDFHSSGVEINCPTGSVNSEQSLNCVECPEGTKYISKEEGVVCEACPKGFFQDMPAQLTCKRCPTGKTTRKTGALSYFECEDACEPGTYSFDGLPPCAPCEQGFYQTSNGQMFCKPCPSSKTTLTFGAQSILECEEFDIAMVVGNKSKVFLTLNETVQLYDFTMSLWVQQQDKFNKDTGPDETLSVVMQDAKGDKRWTWRNLNKIIGQDGSITNVQIDLPDARWHHLLLQSKACNVSVTIDDVPLPVQSIPHGQCDVMSVKSVHVTAENSSKVLFSQLNLWHGIQRLEQNHRCFKIGIGDVVAWQMFGEARLSGAFLNLPSQCDDFNNCVSSPCLHGECTDVLHDFKCTCSKGFKGKQCNINIDDCEMNICMNNATCVDGVNNFTCACREHFTGLFCEIQMVDGRWSEWGNWSECGKTCGASMKKRKRLCNNPTPDNGGTDCVGDAFEYMDCNNTDCPVCPEISAPGNGSLECVNDTENLNCTITCNEGYDFDIEPLREYYCGPHTFHVWNFQTIENPERRLPRCIGPGFCPEIQMPDELKVMYSARYRNLYCANDILEKQAREQIGLVVKSMVTNVPCVRKKTCILEDFNVIDCNNDNRRRRSTRSAGFSLKITSRPNEDNKKETLQDLEDAFRDIQTAANEGQFTVGVLDDDFELDVNTTDVSGEVVCKPGLTRVNFYCVPCGKGAYYYTNYCKPCPVGTFQHEEGKTSCNNCPPGLTTVGIRSSSQDDCSVHQESDLATGIKVTGIVVGCVCGFAAIIAAVFVYRRYSARKGKLVEPSDLHVASKSKSSMSSTNRELGPYNKRFEPNVLSIINV